ncbi:hypothetical protein TWF281_004765 [Arthrobotrys megalospora]
MSNISISSIDSVVTVVPLTPEQLRQTPAEMYRAKQMAYMQQESQSRLALVREAEAEMSRKNEIARNIQYDKMARNAEKRQKAAQKVEQLPTPRRLPTPPNALSTGVSTDPITPRRARPSFPKSDFNENMDDTTGWEDLINGSPSPAPRRKPKPSLDDFVMITEPQLRPLNPLRPYLMLSGPVESMFPQDNEDDADSDETATPENVKSPKSPKSPKNSKISKTPSSPQGLKTPKTPTAADTTTAGPQKSHTPRKSRPRLPPRPVDESFPPGRLPISLIRAYRKIIMEKCPAAWNMLNVYFSRLADPTMDRDELIGLVFWNFEKQTGRKIPNMKPHHILYGVTDVAGLVQHSEG